MEAMTRWLLVLFLGLCIPSRIYCTEVERVLPYVSIGVARGNGQGELYQGGGEIMIGAIVEGPQDGRSSSMGKDLCRGYETYLRWVNSALQGVTLSDGLRYPFRLTTMELERSPEAHKTSAVLATDLIAAKMEHTIILGPYDAEPLEEIRKKLQTLNKSTLLLTAGNSLPNTLADNDVFQLFPNPWHRIDTALATVAGRGADGLSIAVVWEDSNYQRYECSEAAAGRGAVAAYGMRKVEALEIQTDGTTRPFEDALRTIHSRDVSAIVGCFAPENCRRFVRATADLAGPPDSINFDAIILGSCVADPSIDGDEGEYLIAGLNNVTAALHHSPLSVDSVAPGGNPGGGAGGGPPNGGNRRLWMSPSQAQKRRRMQSPQAPQIFRNGLWDPVELFEQYNAMTSEQTVPYHVQLGMITAYVLVQAISNSGSQAAADVKAGLRSGDLASPVGRIRFDATGNAVGVGAVTVQSIRAGRRDELVPIFTQSELLYPKPAAEMLECLTYDQAFTQRTGFGINDQGECVACRDGQMAFWDSDVEHNVCRFCNPGFTAFQLGTLEVLTQLPGVFTDENSEPRFVCVPCAAGLFGETGETCSFCPIGTFSESQNSTECLLCPPGTFAATTGATACRSCDVKEAAEGGQYYAASAGGMDCQRCPAGGLCERDETGSRTSMTNLATYHLVRGQDMAATPRIYKCVHGEEGSACEANEHCYRDPSGQETMTGPFCGVCRDGFGRQAIGGLCQECPALAVSFLYLMCLYLVLVLVCVGLTMLVLLTDFTRPKNQVAIIIKICLSYVQMLTSVLPFIRFWENSFFGSYVQLARWSLLSYTSVTSPYVGIIGWSCVTQVIFPEYAEWKVRTVLGLIFIPLWMIKVFVVFGCWILIRRLRGYPRPPCSTLKAICVVNIFVIHPRCNEVLLTVFKCYTFDLPRMLVDTRVECTSDEHNHWQTIAGLGLIIYSLGIPLWLLLTLSYVHHRNLLKKKSVIKSLGFMYAGFEPTCYYFEPLLMIRRILFPVLAARAVSIAPTSDNDEHGTVLALLALNILFLFIHAALQPFDNRSYFILDRIEDRSLWAVLSLLLAQSFAKATENSTAKAFNSVLAIWVLLMNLRFWSLLLWGLGVRKFVERLVITNDLQYYRPPVIKVTQEGFHFQDIRGNDIAEKSLASIFGELVQHQVLTAPDGNLSYRSLISQLQKMTLVALQSRVMDQTGKGGTFAAVRQMVEKGVEQGILPRSATKAVDRGTDNIDSAANFFSKKVLGRSRTTNQMAAHEPGFGLHVDDGEDEDEEEELRRGHGGTYSGRCQSRLTKTFGLSFTVEEMHRALLMSMRQQDSIEKIEDAVQADFGSDAIARAMGTPTSEDVLGGKMERQHRFIEERTRLSQPIELKGVKRTTFMPPLQSVLGEEADLRAEKVTIREKVEILEAEKRQLQDQLQNIRRTHGVEDVQGIDASTGSHTGEDGAGFSTAGSRTPEGLSPAASSRKGPEVSVPVGSISSLVSGPQRAPSAPTISAVGLDFGPKTSGGSATAKGPKKLSRSSSQESMNSSVGFSSEAERESQGNTSMDAFLELASAAVAAGHADAATKHSEKTGSSHHRPSRRHTHHKPKPPLSLPLEPMEEVPTPSATPMHRDDSASPSPMNQAGASSSSASPTNQESGKSAAAFLSDLDSDINSYRDTFYNALGSLVPTSARGPAAKATTATSEVDPSTPLAPVAEV